MIKELKRIENYILLFPVFILLLSLNMKFYFGYHIIKQLKDPLIYPTFILGSIIYSFVKGKKHNKLISLFGVSVICTTIISIMSKNYSVSLINEIAMFNRYMIVISCINIYDVVFQNHPFSELKEKIFKIIDISLIFIVIVFIISTLTGTQVQTYDAGSGHSGWFLSSNALGNLLVVFLPYSITRLYIKRKFLNILILLSNIILILTVGTKTPFFSLIIFLLIILFFLFKEMLNKKNINTKKIVLVVIVITIMTAFIANSNVISNIGTNGSNLLSNNKRSISLRLKNSYLIKKEFSNSNYVIKLFGMNTYPNPDDINYIEIEALDLFFSKGYYGFIGILIIFSFYFKKFLFLFIRKKNKILVLEGFLVTTSVFLPLFIGLTVGHVLYQPFVMLFYGLIVIYSYYFTLEIEKQN